VHGDSKAEEQAPDQEKFEFNGQDAFIRTDYSEIWDSGATHRNDEPLKMLDSFQSYLERLSADSELANERSELLNLIVFENCNAVFWRRLLNVGTKHPDTLGCEIRSLAWAMPILVSYDTTRVVGDFIKTIFSKLSHEERQRVEQAVLSIPDSFDVEQREGAEQKRDRLVGCLIKDALVTDEAKTLLERLEAEKKIPPNERLFRNEVISGVYTDENFLKDQGVPVGEEQNRRVHTLSQPAKAFAAKHQNATPTFEEVTAIVPDLRSLHKALTTAKADGVHQRQRDTGWGDLADACASAAKVEEWSCGSEDAEFIKGVLLEASFYPDRPNH